MARRSRAGVRGGARRAYNNWASELLPEAAGPAEVRPRRWRCTAFPAAIDEARRCVRELGAVAIIGTPNPVNGQHLHDEACDPLWSALEELNVPIGFHPTGNTSLKDDAGRRYVGHANFQPIAHAIRNPVEADGGHRQHDDGRHPGAPPRLRLRVSRRHRRLALLVAVAPRRPVEKFGPGCEHQLSMLPSEYSSASATSRSTWTRSRRSTSSRRMGCRDYFVSRRTIRTPTARFLRRWSSSSRCRSATSAPQDPLGQLRAPLRHRQGVNHAARRPASRRTPRRSDWLAAMKSRLRFALRTRCGAHLGQADPASSLPSGFHTVTPL